MDSDRRLFDFDFQVVVARSFAVLVQASALRKSKKSLYPPIFHGGFVFNLL